MRFPGIAPLSIIKLLASEIKSGILPEIVVSITLWGGIWYCLTNQDSENPQPRPPRPASAPSPRATAQSWPKKNEEHGAAEDLRSSEEAAPSRAPSKSQRCRERVSADYC